MSSFADLLEKHRMFYLCNTFIFDLDCFDYLVRKNIEKWSIEVLKDYQKKYIEELIECEEIDENNDQDKLLARDFCEQNLHTLQKYFRKFNNIYNIVDRFFNIDPDIYEGFIAELDIALVSGVGLYDFISDKELLNQAHDRIEKIIKSCVNDEYNNQPAFQDQNQIAN